MVLEFLSRLGSDKAEIWCAGPLPHTWTTDAAMLGRVQLSPVRRTCPGEHAMPHVEDF
jgi:hypothetical protein